MFQPHSLARTLAAKEEHNTTAPGGKTTAVRKVAATQASHDQEKDSSAPQLGLFQ
jgi:hypothetical protein